MPERPWIKATHHAAFRSGEWAQIVGQAEVRGRPCYLVIFEDGATDSWVIEDGAAGYEFSDAPPVARLTGEADDAA
jgi:hypothetical protein